PVLVSHVHGRPFRRRPAHDRPADGHGVPAGGRRLGRRRLVQLVPDETRLERDRRAQDRNADLRAVHPAGGVRPACRRPMGRGVADRTRRGRAPGLFGQPFHADLGHVSARRGRVRGRHRRVRRRDGRLLHESRRWLAAPVHRQLCGDVRHGRLRLPDGAAGHPSARTPAGAGTPGSRDRQPGLSCRRGRHRGESSSRGATVRRHEDKHSMKPLPISLLAPLFCLLIALPGAAFAAVDCRAPAAVCEARSSGGLALIERGAPVAVLVGEDDFAAVRHAADALRADLAAVAGTDAEAQSARSDDTAIIAGTLGHSARIDRIVREQKIDTSGVAGTWEAYLLQVVENPEPGIDRALLVVGADRRGTAFGLYELSRRIGVSPWTWWADVPPPRHASLHIAPGRFVDAPKVKYRGIFINDEDPALGNWSKATFGGTNHRFYERVYQLIL